MRTAIRCAAIALAWLGGAAFVVALATFARFYLWTLGRPAPSSSPSPPHSISLLQNVALFTLFTLHHSVLARPAVKRWLTRWVPGWLERSLYVWAASLLFLAVCVAWQRIGGIVYALPTTWRGVGYAVQVAGVVLIARASGALDVLELAGIRQVRDALRGPAPTRTPPEAALRTRGPYRLVRHPVYLGWILLVFGAPLMTLDRFVFATLSTLYLIIAIPLEERSLQAEFGDRYREYAQQVPWRLLPGIY